MTITRRTFLVIAGSMLGVAASIEVGRQHGVNASTPVQPNNGPSPAKVKLNQDTFNPLINRSFTLHMPDGRSTQLKLAALTPYASESNVEQFSLQFTGAPSLELSQGIYEIDLPEKGSVPLFLVPTTMDRRSHYRADFALLT